MTNRKSHVFSCVLALLVLSFACLAATITASMAQDSVKFLAGGGFDQLAPQQQSLVRDWFAEYAKITGNTIDPKSGYDDLKLSVRSTFEAVTDALLKTNLTDSAGKSLGNALSLVNLVESVHGDVPNTRGDQQFRVYVHLQDDALNKLYLCTQFHRTADNGIYHVGYPINFRQLGGSPSIQVSVTRTGLRADIDVDYRSSGGPQALVNGHLTASNSDVRAGNNYFRHIHRWAGMGNWWRGLFGFSTSIPKVDQAALSSSYRKPPVSDSQPVQVAVRDFYQTWLVDRKPQTALAYMSVKANACIAAFSGENAQSSLIRLRLLQHMKSFNNKVGDIRTLDAVLLGVVDTTAGARPVVQDHGKLFALAQITDRLARSIDCRETFNISLAEQLPAAADTFGDYYFSSSLLRLSSASGDTQPLYMVWHREEGTWKIVAWHLDNPFNRSEGPQVAQQEAGDSAAQDLPPDDPALDAATERFLNTWLVARDFPTALKQVAPEARACAALAGTRKKGVQPTVQSWFQEIAAQVPQSGRLSGAIQRVDISHPQMQEVHHPGQQAFTLARISDALASMYNCSARRAGEKPGPSDAIGKAYYTLDAYQTMFQPRHSTGDRGTVVLTWERRRNHWMVVAFDVVTY